MTEAISSLRACLPTVTKYRMQGHRPLKLEAIMLNVEAQKYDSNEVAEEDLVLDLQGVNTEEEYVDRVKQEVTTAIEAPKGATMTMGTETSKTLDKEITPTEADVEMVIEVL